MSFDVTIIIDNLPLFLQGAWLTLRLAFVVFLIGMTLAIFAAIASFSAFPPLRWLVQAYVAVMRGIPFIVLLFLTHYGLPAAGLRVPAMITATAALSLFAGAYYTEIIRACVKALPRGQWEAARTIGMSPTRAAIHVIIPQIVAPMLPPLVNCTVTMIKESSVISSITVAELTFQGLVVQGNTFAPFEVFVAVALLYWAITSIFALAARLLERRMKKGQGGRGLTPLVSRYLILEGRS
ncbi:amino acid ABC transporter permease [Agrobacterium tumefaciens]|nr:amino acid ABC transporter permease [Agrobacterium tumefaciens]TQN60506.1 amino acid ABC transporter permease [Agrobacterium tumefaciens]